MFEYFSDWTGSAVFSRTVTTKNAAGQTVESVESINSGESISIGRWVDKSVQTNTADKFALSEVGRMVLNYQSFYVSVTAGDPPVTTQTAVLPDSRWYATIGGIKYFIEGVDNVGAQNDIYVFTYRKAR